MAKIASCERPTPIPCNNLAKDRRNAMRGRLSSPTRSEMELRMGWDGMVVAVCVRVGGGMGSDWIGSDHVGWYGVGWAGMGLG